MENFDDALDLILLCKYIQCLIWLIKIYAMMKPMLNKTFMAHKYFIADNTNGMQCTAIQVSC